MYVSLANSLLTAIYRPQNPVYYLHIPHLERLLSWSADSSYGPQSSPKVRKAPQSSAELPL